MILYPLLSGLIHDADHYIRENAELEEVSEFYSQIESFCNICLPQVIYQSNAPII